jgi:outer membrane protein
LLFFAGLGFIPPDCHALTLDEAISVAREKLPSYKANEIQVQSSEALFKGSLSPYLPTLRASGTLGPDLSSLDELYSNPYNVELSYLLFDAGNRKANRNIARLNLDADREELRKVLILLEYNVKVAFYSAMAKKNILAERKTQLRDAEKDHEVASGRNRLGVARLSDVLQTSVRLEQAKFNVIQAEGGFNKALSDLNSLLMRPLDSPYDIESSLESNPVRPERNQLADIALQRPDIKQVESVIQIKENDTTAARSVLYPSLSLNVGYQKRIYPGTDIESTEQKVVDVTATWNIFELSNWYKIKSSKLQKGVSEEQLKELKRTVLLDVQKSYEDLLIAHKNLAVAAEQLRQAEHNYAQAFGEYKVGKGDIVALVQAESSLANARDQQCTSQLNLALAKAQLERIAGIERLESMKSVQIDETHSGKGSP